MECKALFISDLHIGTDFFQAKKLLDFLKSFEDDFGNYKLKELYLVGDIFDFIAMAKKVNWKIESSIVLQKLLRMSRKGVKINYILGNHEIPAFFLNGQNFGDIEIKERLIYTTLKNKKILVLHGHQFDGFILKHPWLYWLGDNFYELSVKMSNFLNKIRYILKLPHWSLSLYLKTKVKASINFLNKFEEIAIKECKDNNCDALLFGHTHNKYIKVIDENTTIYNTGCWTEYCSAIIETLDGEIKLLDI